MPGLSCNKILSAALAALFLFNTHTPIVFAQGPTDASDGVAGLSAQDYNRLGMEELGRYDGQDRGRLDAAKGWFDKALAASPGDQDALVGLSRLTVYSGYREDGSFRPGTMSRAMDLADAALAKDPDHAEAHVQKGYVYLYLGELECAVKEAAAALGGGGHAAALLGEVALRKGDLGSARYIWKKALEEAEGSPGYTADAYDALGEITMAEGRYAEAAGYFRESLAIRPKSAWGAANYALALMNSGRTDEAIDILLVLKGKNELPGTGRSLATAYTIKSVELSDAGDTAGAEDCLVKALKLDPGMKPAYVNLAAIYENSGRVAELEGLCKAALKNDPDDAWARRTLAGAVKAGK